MILGKLASKETLLPIFFLLFSLGGAVIPDESHKIGAKGLATDLRDAWKEPRRIVLPMSMFLAFSFGAGNALKRLWSWTTLCKSIENKGVLVKRKPQLLICYRCVGP
jgi:hypothetical protein